MGGDVCGAVGVEAAVKLLAKLTRADALILEIANVRPMVGRSPVLNEGYRVAYERITTLAQNYVCEHMPDADLDLEEG